MGEAKVIPSSMSAMRVYLNKRKGMAGSVLSFDDIPMDIPSISTRCLPLDYILGVGGLPLGRIVEIIGPESSGKSTLLIQTMTACQKDLKRPVLYLDYEHAFAKPYAETLGLNMHEDWLAFCQPSTFEEGMEIIHNYLNANLVGMIIVDTIASMTTIVEAESAVTDGNKTNYSLAKGMARELRRLTAKVHSSNCCLAFINQERDDVAAARMGIQKKTTSGGKALRFYASIRLQLKRIGGVVGSEEHFQSGQTEKVLNGQRIRAEVIKNKVGVPFKYCEFTIIFGKGIDEVYTASDMMVSLGIVEDTSKEKGARIYQVPVGEEIVTIRGQQNFNAYMRENKSVFDSLRKKLVDKMYNVEKEESK